MTTNQAQPSNEIFNLLKAPFPSRALEWKIGNMNKDKTRGRALPYLKFQAVADRLDAVLGEHNWRNSYVAGPAGGVVCRLEVRVDNEWIAKENGAGNTEKEGIKGGLTDAFKRAATMFGVGRYLHSYESIGVDVDDRGHFQAPALPDFLLPADEVEQNRKDAEAAALAEKDAAVTVAAAIEAAGGTGGEAEVEVVAVAVAAKPAKPAKVAKAADVKDETPLEVQPESGTGEASAIVELATTPPTQVVVDGPADTAPVDTLEGVTQATAEPVAEAAAAEAIVEAAVEAAAEVQGEQPTEVVVVVAAEATATVDADGVPVMPTDLQEDEAKLVKGLVERIAKNIPLNIIREYVVEGKGKTALGDKAKAYVIARLDHKQVELDAGSKAQAA